MPLIMECSRCHTTYKSYYTAKINSKNSYNALITIDKHLEGRYTSREHIDLCPKCKDSFKMWLYWEE